MFYIPRCIWLSMEGGLMNFLVKGTQGLYDDGHNHYMMVMAMMMTNAIMIYLSVEYSSTEASYLACISM